MGKSLEKILFFREIKLIPGLIGGGCFFIVLFLVMGASSKMEYVVLQLAKLLNVQ